MIITSLLLLRYNEDTEVSFVFAKSHQGSQSMNLKASHLASHPRATTLFHGTPDNGGEAEGAKVYHLSQL